ncbi:MAG: PEGA domain-containing protein [Deltaproteobacteria bacterium]|nr:PEGA domain-containing protein [Deltaproteobacteria bacterium]
MLARRAVPLGLVLAFAWTGLAVGDAREDEAARLFEEGTRLYNAGSYREAIDAFEAANAVLHAPANLYNLARCYEKLGEFRIALGHYERFLSDPTATERELVERRVAELSAMPVDLVVASAPAGARIHVDARDEAEALRTPAIVKLRPGIHVVRVTLTGYLPAERSVELRPLTPDRLQLDLVPERVARPPRGRPEPTSPASVLGEIRARRDDRTLLWRLSVALGASKYDDTAFVIGADGGPIWSGFLLNLHWFAMTSSFSGQIALELLYDRGFSDFDLLLGGGFGATQVRGPEDHFISPELDTSAFLAEAVAGLDFFLRRQLAVGLTLRLQFQFDDEARDNAGIDGDNPLLLILASGHVTLQL